MANPIRCKFFTVFPRFSNLDTRQLTEVAMVTNQQGFTFRTGYEGDYPHNAADKKLDGDRVVVRYQTDPEETVLKHVTILSMDRAPFEITVSLQSYPRPDEAINQKYLQAMNETGTLDDIIERLRALLEKNPTESPMIPEDQIPEPLRLVKRGSYTSKEGWVDLRTKIKYAKSGPCL